MPEILEDAVYVEELTIEVIPMPKRMDGAHWITHRGKKKPLNIEFQSGPEPRLIRRMGVYHAILCYDYDCEAVSLLVYVFRCDLEESPFEEDGLRFPLYILGMWTLDGRSYVEKHVMCMYTMLPTMGNVDAALLLQSIDEMVQYYKRNQAKLARCLLWFTTFLDRTDTVTREDKLEVEKRLSNFEHLLEESQWAQRHRAIWEKQATEKALVKGEQIGIDKGEQIGIDKGILKGLQEAVMQVISTRFPTLVSRAQPQVQQIKRVEDLKQLLTQLLVANDEAAAIKLLHIPSA